MAPQSDQSILRLGLPKGRMQEAVFALLAEAGIRVRVGGRAYRPAIDLPGFEVKLLKPQNIVEMVQAGSRDLGLTGADWVAELDGGIVELLDLGLDPVEVVAAVPAGLLEQGWPPEEPIVVASEYERLTRTWIDRNGLSARFVRSYGATEVFPPEDADCIVDNTATGSTLQANGLEIVDTLMTSSTRLYANESVLAQPAQRERIETFVLLLRSVLEARRRVMVEVNVSADDLDVMVAILPCMREPTISPLRGEGGYAVKVAAPRDLLPGLIPEIKARGGTDIVVTALSQIVP
jgi:ATP phosphoribosyltransferase